MIEYKIKQQGEYPRQDQVEFIQMSINRISYLSIELKEAIVSERERFLLLKELVSIYSELELYPPIKSHLETIPSYNELLKFGPLFKVIRHLLAHFPFFNTWEEFWFDRNLINAMPSKGNTIQKYFSKDNHPEFFFKFQTREGKILDEGKVISPKGYLENKRIYLKDIMAFDHAISLVVGYTNLVVGSIISNTDLHFF